MLYKDYIPVTPYKEPVSYVGQVEATLALIYIIIYRDNSPRLA